MTKPETTNDYAKEHAIELYNQLHGIKYANVPDCHKASRDNEIKLIMKALRIYAVGATGNA